MKIRIGFVSNSSSASFICRKCGEEYDVECRGGTDDDWVPPKDGLCEECQKTLFICKCGEIKERNKTVQLCLENHAWDEGYEIMTDTGLALANSHVCPKCFVMCSDFHEKFEEWTKKITNPEYELTPIDKKVIKAAAAQGMKVGR